MCRLMFIVTFEEFSVIISLNFFVLFSPVIFIYTDTPLSGISKFSEAMFIF